MNFSAAFFLLFLVSLPSFAITITPLAQDADKAAIVQSELMKAGIDSASISNPSEDSIFILTDTTTEADWKNLKSGLYPRAWAIQMSTNPANTNAKLQSLLHNGIPASRVFTESAWVGVVNRVNEIRKEKDHLKLGIAGLNTQPAPVPTPQYNKKGELLKSYPVAPLGSAILTDSGYMKKTGIKAVIHAASGAMTHIGPGYEPTLESIQNCLINSVALARENGYTRVAVPIIAGSIFRGRLNNGQGMPLSELVDHIILNSLAPESAGMHFVLTVRANAILDDDNDEGKWIRQSFAKLKPEDQSKFEIVDNVDWAIVKYDAHQSPAIINSANMEFLFGGGVSGVIADAADGTLPPDHTGELEINIGPSKFQKSLPWASAGALEVPPAALPSHQIDVDALSKIELFKK